MKNYSDFIFESKDMKKEQFFYFIKQGSFLVCDIECCAKSPRTFDIKFFDFAKNEKLLKIVGIDLKMKPKNKSDRQYVIDNFSRFQDYKEEKLLTNPTLRILAENEKVLIDLLEVFEPDDIRVSMRKYNL